MKKVRDSVEFAAVQKREKNAFLKRTADVFYLPGEKDVFKEFLIIYGLKEVKEMCMRLAGRTPLNWKGN
ncbi:MAG: hypothetical protein A3D87_05415 [Omnitrophica WOR_2 bacterium RIFCSPHIGHO2_02_FULL_50_17]|nr:MAG: hypothetical protein A3D87_05415 [Omnitrophica WOR_2 bacterium RIFCSPHIGHO2_02_FULL_50_17]